MNNDFEKCFDKWQASKNTMKYEQKVRQFSRVLAVMAKVWKARIEKQSFCSRNILVSFVHECYAILFLFPFSVSPFCLTFVECYFTLTIGYWNPAKVISHISANLKVFIRCETCVKEFFCKIFCPQVSAQTKHLKEPFVDNLNSKFSSFRKTYLCMCMAKPALETMHT